MRADQQELPGIGPLAVFLKVPQHRLSLRLGQHGAQGGGVRLLHGAHAAKVLQ